MPAEPSTRVGANSLLPELFRDLGHDPAALLAAAGLAPDALADPEARVPVAGLGRLLAEAVAVSGRRDFGLLLARRAGARFTGALLHWLSDSRTMRELLERYPRLIPINTRTAAARLRIETDRARLELSADFPVQAVATIVEEGMVCIAVAGFRTMLGERWRPLAVEFAHAPTAPAATYQHLLGCRVAFNCLRSAIIFTSDDLGRRPIPRPFAAAPVPVPPVSAYCSLEDRTRAAIRARLADPGLDRATIARDLGLSARTLNRRLAEQGLSFAGMLQETRYRTARYLLTTSDTRLGAIALAVGYPEQSAFSRAFRQWSGSSPRSFRLASRNPGKSP